MSIGYKSLSKTESTCSLNSSVSSPGDDEVMLDKVVEEETDGGEKQVLVSPPVQPPVVVKQPSVYVYRCRHCQSSFHSRQHGVEGYCVKAPNYIRENIDKLCIVTMYRGCWYHCTKDMCDDDEGVNILRCNFPDEMSISLWIKYILITLLCAPCLCLWIPFFLWERQTRTICGPRHSIRRRRQPRPSVVSVGSTKLEEVKITIEPISESMPPEGGGET